MDSIALSGAAIRAFRRQQDACAEMGSGFTASICRLIADRGLPSGVVFDRLSTWPGIHDNTGDAVPLRLTGALHRLVLDQADGGLIRAYPPSIISEDQLYDALCNAVIMHGAFIGEYLDSAPQTNEVGRSSLLLPALLKLGGKYGKPMFLFEIGASAGLNQNLQHFHYDFGDWQWGDDNSPVRLTCGWRGEPFPLVSGEIDIRATMGCDLSPVDVSSAQEQMRLTSYVWPDQAERLDRLVGAIKIASKHQPNVTKSSAGDWLEAKLDSPIFGEHTIIMHTIMWPYMPMDEQSRCEASIRAFGAKAKSDSPVSWLRFESDGKSPGGLLSVINWNGGEESGEYTELARADYHGKWIDWM